MPNQLETFKLKLEELKKMGVNVDPKKITEEIIQAQVSVDTSEEDEQKLLFGLIREKVIGLIDDYDNFYRPKGRKLRVIVEIIKENSADKYGEKFIYSDDMDVVSVIGIGTKGKYEKTIEET